MTRIEILVFLMVISLIIDIGFNGKRSICAMVLEVVFFIGVIVFLIITGQDINFIRP